MNASCRCSTCFRKPGLSVVRVESAVIDSKRMSVENRRRLDELLCKLGAVERAKDVTPKKETASQS
jgi:hypothetical protein